MDGEVALVQFVSQLDGPLHKVLTHLEKRGGRVARERETFECALLVAQHV